jgi:hypothetical protein
MTSHLDALELRLSHERDRLNRATAASEIEMRSVWVKQIEREIADERSHLGISPEQAADISDDELFAALFA